MLIKTLVVGHICTNCYVVTDENSLECAVIDPGAESNTILNYIESNNLKCRAILITHSHFDHVTALPKVAAATGAQVWINEKDLDLGFGDMHRFKPPEGTKFYKEGDRVEVGSLVFEVLETPGHTPGGVSLICEDALFSGDTLFRGSCGRTDFGGDVDEEMRSLKKLAMLPGDYEVYPGHDMTTTLSREREFNPYMQKAVRDF